jgi:phosphomannomutase
MNLAVVIRATAGLVAYLKTLTDREPRVVIGCDARYGSVDFARAAARVVSAAGGRALALLVSNPTPLTSFAVRALDADAGIMITASHNPAKDNGYKVTSAARPSRVSPRRPDRRPARRGHRRGDRSRRPGRRYPPGHRADEDCRPRDAYVEAAAALARGEAERAGHTITLTPCTGSGAPSPNASCAKRDSPRVILVAEQAAPTRTSRRSPSPTRKSPAPSTSQWPCTGDSRRSHHRRRPGRRTAARSPSPTRGPRAAGASSRR